MKPDQFKESLDKLKEKARRYKNWDNLEPEDKRPLKFGGAILGFLLGAGVLYWAKREQAIRMTLEQAIEAIKKSQANVVYIVREVKKDGVDHRGRENGRRIYLRIDGVQYVTYTPEIQLFYQKIRQLERSKSAAKSKLIQKEEDHLDSEFRRFVIALNKVFLPLLFPVLLFKSSVGKIFKTSVLGQLEGFRPQVKFKDIAGLGNAKIEVSQLVDFLRNPQKYRRMGAKVPKGALLSGPPGTGKTMLAKACAGEAAVPFFSVSGSEFVELYAGMGATRVRQLFRNAKKNTPAIIFIDEIDAIGRKRDDKFGGAHDQRANTLNQLLVQMDGFGTSQDLIILAATNRKQMLDPALTRPGRFDRIVQIQLPDIQGRREILEIYLSKIRLAPIQSLLQYARRLATLTYGFSGADLANLCNEAAILAVRREKAVVEPKDFQSASDRVLAGLEQTLNLDDLQKRKVAYHQAGHAVVAWFSEGASPLLKITIVPRSKGSLGFAQYLPNQSSLMNRRQLVDQLCVILGGRMAEEHFFGEVTNGAADDLKKVRGLARAVVVRYGMSDLLPNYAPPDSDGQNIYSEETAAKIDREVIRLIQNCTQQTRRMVRLYKDKITALAEQVLKKQSLNHTEIKEILGQRPFQIKENYKQFLDNVAESIPAESK